MKIVIIIGLIILFFIAGYSFGSKELPLNQSIKNLFTSFFIQKDLNIYEEINPIFYKTDIEKLIEINSDKDIYEKREQLKKFIWKNSFPGNSEIQLEKNISLEKFSNLKNLSKIDKLSTIMDYGLISNSYLFSPINSNQELIIYHEGHAGDVVNGIESIQILLDNNYTVLAMTLPLLGDNNNPEVDIERIGVITLEKHNDFIFLDSDDFSSIKFFMEPIFSNLNFLEKNYQFKTFHMIGLSGGAWATTIYPAIDTRIEKSFPVGGPLPLFLTINVPGSYGDYETNLPELYKITNYLELYIMGSHGDDRKQLKIINKYDSCCYGGITYKLFDSLIAQKLELLEKGKFEIFLDESHYSHKISELAMTKILNVLKDNL